METEKILVTGATGKVGRELVPLLLESGIDVRAGTRSPERAAEMLPPEVEVLELNYDWAATYDAALTWADRVFLVPPPFSPDAFEAMGAFIDWAVGAKVRQIVLLTGMGVPSDVALRRVEMHLEGQEVDHAILRPNLYMQNFHPGFLSDEIRETCRIRVPAGDGAVSLVDVRDVAEVAARTLAGGTARSGVFTLTGPESLTMEEAADVLAGATGRAVRYEAIPDREFRATLEERGWRAAEVDVALGLVRSIREGARDEVHPDVETVLGRPARRFGDYARDLAGHWA